MDGKGRRGPLFLRSRIGSALPPRGQPAIGIHHDHELIFSFSAHGSRRQREAKPCERWASQAAQYSRSLSRRLRVVVRALFIAYISDNRIEIASAMKCDYRIFFIKLPLLS